MDDAAIRSVIDGVIRRQLAGHEIIRIDTRWGEDFNGDDVLSVDVVIGDDISIYDGKKLLGLGRLLKSALRNKAVSGFPLVRYLSNLEASEITA